MRSTGNDKADFESAGRRSALSEPSSPLLAVPLQGVHDDRLGEFGWLQIVYLDRFSFQRFVVEKEPLDQRQTVRRQFARLVKAVEFRIVEGHGQNLVVFLAA